MPLDPSIILGYKPPEIENPLNAIGKLMAVRNAQQEGELGALKMDEYRRTTDETRQLGDAYKESVGPDGTLNRSGLLTSLAKRGLGAKVPTIQKGFADQDKSMMEAEKLKLETGITKANLGAQILSSVKDQASYDAARQEALARGLDVSRMPPQFDPAFIQAKLQETLSFKDQLEQKWKEKEYTTPKADALLSAQTSTDNNRRSVAATRDNADATRAVAQATRDAASIQTGFSNEQSLRKEFEGLPEVKNYKQAFPAFAAIKDAVARNTTQSDINIVYGLAKLYDPTSVVREGEYATVANSPNIPEKVKGYAQYLAGGGKLSADTKAKILQEAQGRIGTYETEAKKAKGSYEGIAKKRGMDPAAVFADMGNLTQGGGPVDLGALPNGTTPKVVNFGDLH
jgi:hypothetical protein